MLLIVGALIVLASVVGGYLMEGGHILLLSQPAEFLIIGGAAIGSLLISTPTKRPQDARSAVPRHVQRRAVARRLHRPAGDAVSALPPHPADAA